ncbi:hypothetical protein L6452_26417 [Arctium lappa]|uniref:Uncharacterized protein n=1 Tax=Arctium lappa TaxID=4217 RepID=A0ACB8ZV58_ARCLA|nr:hypothetical protein L6452_26417 [Arctium lappa]
MCFHFSLIPGKKMTDTSKFSTEQVFGSREELMTWREKKPHKLHCFALLCCVCIHIQNTHTTNIYTYTYKKFLPHFSDREKIFQKVFIFASSS